MKSKVMPHMIVAVILALVAGVLTIRWLGSMRGPSEAPQPKAEAKKVDVAVASRPIPKGTRLDASLVRFKPYGADVVPTGAMLDMAEIEGRLTAREISQDDAITPDKLLPKGTTIAGLEGTVPPGKRALTVKGTKILGAGGLITPGSRVDVVATFQVSDGGEKKVGKLILEDIPILTTGTELETRVGKDGREELASTDLFTLMVTPEQAERLALASDQGTLHFALRRSGDAGSETTPGVELRGLAGMDKDAGPPARPEGESARYVYHSVRGSAPRAASSGGAPAAPAAGPGGGDSGQAPPPAGNPAASGAAPLAGDGPRAKPLDQGTDMIRMHQVTIDIEPAQPQKPAAGGKP